MFLILKSFIYYLIIYILMLALKRDSLRRRIRILLCSTQLSLCKDQPFFCRFQALVDYSLLYQICFSHFILSLVIHNHK